MYIEISKLVEVNTTGCNPKLTAHDIVSILFGFKPPRKNTGGNNTILALVKVWNLDQFLRLESLLQTGPKE